MAVALAVVSGAILTGLAMRWWRRNAPVPIGEGIQAIGRISRGVGVSPSSLSSGLVARRRRQIRLVSSVGLGALAVAVVVSSHRRGLAEAFATLLVVRVAFEVLAHRRPRNAHR